MPLKTEKVNENHQTVIIAISHFREDVSYSWFTSGRRRVDRSECDRARLKFPQVPPTKLCDPGAGGGGGGPSEAYIYRRGPARARARMLPGRVFVLINVVIRLCVQPYGRLQRRCGI